MDAPADKRGPAGGPFKPYLPVRQAGLVGGIEPKTPKESRGPRSKTTHKLGVTSPCLRQARFAALEGATRRAGWRPSAFCLEDRS